MAAMMMDGVEAWEMAVERQIGRTERKIECASKILERCLIAKAVTQEEYDSRRRDIVEMEHKIDVFNSMQDGQGALDLEDEANSLEYELREKMRAFRKAKGERKRRRRKSKRE